MLVIVNERIRMIRVHREKTSKWLAERSGLSEAEVSRIEGHSRTPKLETIQRIAAALDVSVSYLIGEKNADIALSVALAQESLGIFLRDEQITPAEEEIFNRIALEQSSPQTCGEWKNFRQNLAVAKQL
jgi:transcriptional regulator with XRE-family HTH domain